MNVGVKVLFPTVNWSRVKWISFTVSNLEFRGENLQIVDTILGGGELKLNVPLQT